MKIEQLLNEPRFVALRDRLRIDDRKLSLIIVIFLTLVIYLDVQFIMKRQFEGLGKLGSEIARLKTDLEFVNKNLPIMQSLEGKQAQPQDLTATKAKKLMREEEINALYQDISVLAKRNNVRIVLMKPKRESPASKVEKAAISENYTPLLLSLDLVCNYHRLAGFINDLENGEALLIVQNIKIMPQQDDLSGQKVDLVLKTYLGR
ncbi:MAG: type 4a pilus biogenesis protein PilO [Candidatus Omnitrophota bacterium]